MLVFIDDKFFEAERVSIEYIKDHYIKDQAVVAISIEIIWNGGVNIYHAKFPEGYSSIEDFLIRHYGKKSLTILKNDLTILDRKTGFIK